MIRICVFAKPPVPGAVKTRLAASIGADRAAALAAAFLADTWALARSRPWADAVIASTGPIAGMEIWDQGDGDLGARIERILRRAVGPAIALGADTPGLPPELLDEAAAHLERGDAVLGPADDGGFYLLGVPRCPVGMLAGVAWSAPTTCAEVAARLRSHGLAPRLLAPWFDVDRVADLARLAAMLA